MRKNNGEFWVQVYRMLVFFIRKLDLNWTCFSVHTRTERYDIIPFQFLVHFSVPPNYISGPVLERSSWCFSVPVWTHPLSIPIFGPDGNGTMSFPLNGAYMPKFQGMAHQILSNLSSSACNLINILEIIVPEYCERRSCHRYKRPNSGLFCEMETTQLRSQARGISHYKVGRGARWKFSWQTLEDASQFFVNHLFYP